MSQDVVPVNIDPHVSHYIYIHHLIGWASTVWYCPPARMVDDITSRLPDDGTMTMVTLTMGHGQMHLWVPDDIMRCVAYLGDD